VESITEYPHQLPPKRIRVGPQLLLICACVDFRARLNWPAGPVARRLDLITAASVLSIYPEHRQRLSTCTDGSIDFTLMAATAKAPPVLRIAQAAPLVYPLNPPQPPIDPSQVSGPAGGELASS
jgi:hypothetical protein